MKHGLPLALLFLLIGNFLAWFQGNLQFISDWWYNKPWLTIALFSVPTASFFFFGWRFLVEHLDDSLWSARLFSFGLGTLLFAILSHFVKGEVVTKKTVICILLSVSIVLIQAFWNDEPTRTAEVERGDEG